MTYPFSIRRILIVRTDRMGDLILSLPAVHAIRQGFPQAEISLLVQSEIKPLLEGHPDLDRLLSTNSGSGKDWREILRTAAWLRRRSFDAILVLNPTRAFHVASFLARIPVRVGYRRKWGFLLTHSMPDTKPLRNLHESQYNLELVRLLGIQPQNSPPTLPTHANRREEVEALLRNQQVAPDQKLIAVHPWTSNPAKGWPLDCFWEVTRRLESLGACVLLIGKPGSTPDSLTLPNNAVNLVDRTPIGMLPDLLRRCAMLLSNDSGPAHIAAAVGTPTVVVAPAEHRRQMDRWKPLGDRHQILLSPEVETVFQAVKNALRCGS